MPWRARSSSTSLNRFSSVIASLLPFNRAAYTGMLLGRSFAGFGDRFKGLEQLASAAGRRDFHAAGIDASMIGQFEVGVKAIEFGCTGGIIRARNILCFINHIGKWQFFVRRKL